ncbi:MAG: DUF58 domain-containing protein, partial [Planctomycetota bacterium]
HLDRVTAIGVPGDDARTFTGKGQAAAFFTHLLSLEPGGETDLLESVKRALPGPARGSVAVLVSDLLDPRGFRRAVDFLLHRRHRVFLVQVVAPEEADPANRGPLRLVDSESGRTRDLRVTDGLLDAYRKTFRRFCARVERYAREKEIGHARIRTDVPYGEAVLEILKRGSVIR